MRIAGGVLLLLIGVFSLAEGGCVAIGCNAASQLGSALSGVGSALQNKNASADDLKRAAEQTGGANLEKMAKSAASLTYVSILIRVAGLLCLVAGILFFVNKARIFGFIAPGVGIVAEIALMVMMAFTAVGLVKLLVYAFGAIAATRVGQPSRS